MNSKLLISVISVLLLAILVYRFYPEIKEYFIQNRKVVEEQPVVHQRIFNAKSKCFDCEKQINKYNTSAYNLIHPTKCFDCENQIDKMYNSKNSNLGHSTKCFTCESN